MPMGMVHVGHVWMRVPHRRVPMEMRVRFAGRIEYAIRAGDAHRARGGGRAIPGCGLSPRVSRVPGNPAEGDADQFRGRSGHQPIWPHARPECRNSPLGLAVEYSTLYLTDRFKPSRLPTDEPLYQRISLVEFAFDRAAIKPQPP